MIKQLYQKSLKLAAHKSSKTFLAITIGIIITSGGIGKNELSIKDTRPK